MFPFSNRGSGEVEQALKNHLGKAAQQWTSVTTCQHRGHARAQASEQRHTAHSRGCLREQLSAESQSCFLNLYGNHVPTTYTEVDLKGNHYPDEQYFAHHPLTQVALLINNALTVDIFHDPRGIAIEVVCWLLSLRSHKITYVCSGGTHMCLSARKLAFSSVRSPCITVP